MKHRNVRAVAAALLLILLAGCAPADTGTTPPPSTEPTAPASPEPTVPPEETVWEKDFGAYTVPAGWVESELYSSDDKFFYLRAGEEELKTPDNVSVEVGENRYAADEHEQFRDAIVRQLMFQIQEVEGVNLLGDGTYTQQGDILYIFTIEEPDVVTRQYYIVGDHRYCLIHLTNFTDSEDAEDAARQMADSFVWAG